MFTSREVEAGRASPETHTVQCLNALQTERWSHFMRMRRGAGVIGGCSAFIPARCCSSRRGSLGSQGPPTPPPLRTTCCSPVRCVRRDLLWPPLLPGFGSLVQILRSSSAQHTHPLYTNGQAAHAYTRTHTHTDTCTHTRMRTHAQHRSWLL